MGIPNVLDVTHFASLMIHSTGTSYEIYIYTVR